MANVADPNDQALSPEKQQPSAGDLFIASLMAAALVYCAAAVLFSGFSFLGTQSGGLLAVVQTFALFATFGLAVAVFLSFLFIAPLGTALGMAILRITPPAWWQGALTGLLVALSFEGLVLLALMAVPSDDLQLELGNLVMFAIPVVLAVIAGAYVQRRVLHWPGNA